MAHKLSELIHDRGFMMAVKNVLLVILGSFILALGNALFIVPPGLVTGGVSAIGVIAQHFVSMASPDFKVVDIITAGLTIFLFFIGLFFCGKKFALRSLVATIAYPIFFAILYRIPSITYLSDELMKTAEPLLGLLLCGIFGGVLIGLGVAVAFLGNGSTGGLDILAYLIAKHTPIKESISTFVFDATLIILGATLRLDMPNNVPLALIGIFSALITSLVIHFVYVEGNTYIICEIITCKEEEVKAFIHEKLDRGTTIYECVGGYTGTPRKMIRAAMAKDEAVELQAYLATIDPKAFMTFSRATNINGEGFVPFSTRRPSKTYPKQENADDGK